MDWASTLGSRSDRGEAIGLTFASALRATLRQDPDVIMLARSANPETAQIACRAALVGRLVLSTLHTNSPEAALTRLVDLGVEEFIVRDVLRGTLGQRVEPVRCVKCGSEGCASCGATGLTGRRLVAELVPANTEAGDPTDQEA